MNRKLDIWKWLAPLTLLLASACGHDNLVPPDVYVEEKTPYVELRIAMPAGVSYVTRANPMGGEEGNGREEGILNEDKIHDVNIFFYIEEKGKGMNSRPETPILNHIFYNLDNRNDSRNTKLWSGEANVNAGETVPYFDKNYLVLKFECSAEERQQIESTGISFLVIANVDLMQEVQTIGDLRTIDLGLDGTNNWNTNYDAYSVNASKMDYFLMSTAYSDNYSYNGQSTGKNRIEKEGDDYLGITTLQRMYARIDLWYNEADNAMMVMKGDAEVVGQLKYSVKEAGGNSVYLTNVLPVNIMQKPSYIFKRVTDFGEGFDNWTTEGFKGKMDFLWGGKENPSDGPNSGTEYNDKPINYVIERHTTEKTPDGTGGLSSNWFGKTAKDKIMMDITDKANGHLSGYYHGKPNSESNPDYGCDHIAIISYANENTHPIDCFHPNYLTGLAFRGIYVPGKIYKCLLNTSDAADDLIG
ncbi:MAG: hypothetical protein K2J58_06565, partial [Muribaculaceae bacterium]|nr:hypothetical protein [Muribaculaceae bacterium]